MEIEQPAHGMPATLEGQDLPGEIEQPAYGMPAAVDGQDPTGEVEQSAYSMPASVDEQLPGEIEQPSYGMPAAVDGEEGSVEGGGVGEDGDGDGDGNGGGDGGGDGGWAWSDPQNAQDNPQDEAGVATFVDAPQSGDGQEYVQQTQTPQEEGMEEGEGKQGDLWPLDEGSHQDAADTEAPAEVAAYGEVASASNSGTGTGTGSGSGRSGYRGESLAAGTGAGTEGGAGDLPDQSAQNGGSGSGFLASVGTGEVEIKYGEEGGSPEPEQWQVQSVSEKSAGRGSGLSQEGSQDQQGGGGFEQERFEDAEGAHATDNGGGGGDGGDGGDGGGDLGSEAQSQAGDNHNGCASREDCGGGHWTCSSDGACECPWPFAGSSCQEDTCGESFSCDACRDANTQAADGAEHGCEWADGVCRVSAGPLSLELLPACPDATAEAAAAVVPSVDDPQPALPQLLYGAGMPLLFLVVCGGLLMLVAKCARRCCRGGSNGPNYTP